jgi:hypothetical protein
LDVRINNGKILGVHPSPIPVIQHSREIKVQPIVVVIADSLYGSDENCEAAKKMGVEVVSPVMGTPTEKTYLVRDGNRVSGKTFPPSPCREAAQDCSGGDGRPLHLFIFQG